MVLKKPYAFIIKHFRAIHLLLLIPVVYILFKTRGIVNFFNSYVVTGYSINFSDVLTNISGQYINILMYIAIILIIGVFIILSILLQQKEKPTKFYNVNIIYYIVLFLLITASFGIFNGIENDTLDDVFARIIRDIGFIVYLSEYIFAILIFIRGIGFNIKKFNFKSDLQDLEISSEDSEEFEFLVGKDTYEAKRAVRRFFRELKYYYLENKFIFTIIVLIAVISLGTFIYMNREIKEKVYKENESFSFGQVNLKIKDSYISNLDYNGKVLDDNKTYVILLLEVKNRYETEKKFNHENLGLIVNKKRVQPNIIKGSYFRDFGNPFTGSVIKGNSEIDYVLVYEIDKHLANANFKLEAYSHTTSTPGSLGIVNKEIKIKPTIINSKVVTNNVSKGTKINLSNTSLRKSIASISDYEITSRYEYPICASEDNCIVNSITSWEYSNGYNKKLLVLDYSLALDEESIYYKLGRDYKTFFDDFLEIKYRYNGKEYISKVNVLNPKNYSDKLIVIVPKEITTADSIYAIITIRNISYQIKLK